MMSERMTLDRLQRLLEAYGASPDRWPSEERDRALELLKTSPEIQDLHRQACELDEILDQAAMHEADGDLLADLLATAGTPAWGRWAATIWPFGPIWKPALGLTMAAAMGVVLGFVMTTSAETAQIAHEIESLILG